MQSRKHDSITDEDVACLLAPGGSQLTEQERLAIKFLDLLSATTNAIDDEVYRELGHRLHHGPSRGARVHVCEHHGGAPLHPHPRRLRHEPTGHRLQQGPGGQRIRRRPAADVDMSETVLVTGATGLAGANICKLLVERGDGVRALARPTADTEPLVALGVEVVPGDITVAGDVRRAATGADSAIHSAALLGGASQNLPDFEAVNVVGTKHVLDAAEALGMRRVVAVSTGTFFDTKGGLEREDASVTKEPAQIPTRSPRWRRSRTPWPGRRPDRTS